MMDYVMGGGMMWGMGLIGLLTSLCCFWLLPLWLNTCFSAKPNSGRLCRAPRAQRVIELGRRQSDIQEELLREHRYIVLGLCDPHDPRLSPTVTPKTHQATLARPLP
jgi:hypothetical protein